MFLEKDDLGYKAWTGSTSSRAADSDIIQFLGIGIGALISLAALSQIGFSIPLVITLAYAFLAIRFEDTSILDFIKYAVKYFFVEQQEFRWRLN